METFTKWGLKAAVVNATSLSTTPTLLKDIQNGNYQVVVLSPEDFLSTTHLKPIIMSKFSKHAIVVVDEAHSISTWGGDFRQSYAKLGEIRSFVPPGVPFLAASATLPPKVLRRVKESLLFNEGSFKFVNRGNYRSNLKWEIRTMVKTGRRTVEEVNFVIPKHPTVDKLERTLVYVNCLVDTHIVARHLRTRLPDHLKSQVQFYHAMRSEKDKARILKGFMADEFRILVCTEAVGVVRTLSARFSVKLTICEGM